MTGAASPAGKYEGIRVLIAERKQGATTAELVELMGIASDRKARKRLDVALNTLKSAGKLRAELEKQPGRRSVNRYFGVEREQRLDTPAPARPRQAPAPRARAAAGPASTSRRAACLFGMPPTVHEGRRVGDALRWATRSHGTGRGQRRRRGRGVIAR